MDDNGGVSIPNLQQPLSASVLVLNRNYTAVRVVSARRAFSLLYTNSAEVIDAHDEQWDVLDFQAWVDLSRRRKDEAGHHDLFVCTPRHWILVPRVIRLVAYDKVPRREVKFSRRNILARDENRCQYCGKRLPCRSSRSTTSPPSPGREVDLDERGGGLQSLQHAQRRPDALGSLHEAAPRPRGPQEESHAGGQGRIAHLPHLAPLPGRRRDGHRRMKALNHESCCWRSSP
jgi:hypothetical protein